MCPFDLSSVLAPIAEASSAAQPEPPIIAPSDKCEHGAAPDDLCTLCPEDVAIHRFFEGALNRAEFIPGIAVTDENLREAATRLRRAFQCDFEAVLDRVLEAESSPSVYRALHDGLQSAFTKLIEKVGRPAYAFRNEFEARWKSSPPAEKPVAKSVADFRAVVVQVGDAYGWLQDDWILVAANHANHAARLVAETAEANGWKIYALRAITPGGAQ